MGHHAEPVHLKPETLVAYQEHVRQADAEMRVKGNGNSHFLWSQGSPERMQQLGEGETIAQLWSGDRPLKVADGLIHDWIGATCVPGATLERTLALLQDYDNHKKVYYPEVIDSRLLSRQGDHFQAYLRLLKKKILTVVIDTDHDVQYSVLDSSRAICRSHTTRVSEVEDAGKSSEKVGPPDTGYGYLWRMDSYWRFQQAGEYTYIECRAITLTRDVPKALAWIIEPMLLKLPGESLKTTLDATRRGLIASSMEIHANVR